MISHIKQYMYAISSLVITSKYVHVLNYPPPPKKKKKKKKKLNLYFIHQPISTQNVASNNEAKCWYFNNHRNSVSTLEVGLPCTLSGEYPPFKNDITVKLCCFVLYSFIVPTVMKLGQIILDKCAFSAIIIHYFQFPAILNLLTST